MDSLKNKLLMRLSPILDTARRSSLGSRSWLLLAIILVFGLVPGAMAQGSEMIVVMTEMENRAFPQMTLSMAVSDENGPLDNLAPGNFQIFEGGNPVPTASMTVEHNTLKDLRLILALDISIPDDDDFTQIKESAKNLVASLDPRDRVAVISFAEDVSLVHDFTNNSDELQSVIDNLKADISYTASHKALAEAVTRLNKQPTGWKAVIVVTDSRNNIGPSAIDETIAQAQDSDIPLYIIGFGDKVQSDPLIEKVGLTGGQYLALTGVDQVQPTLRELGTKLRQGYKITFWSGLRADDAPHQLSVVVTNEGTEAQAEGSFVAKSNPVTIALSGLTEGQTVAKVVNLTAQVTTSAPSVSVEYFLDDELLAERTEPPYAFAWDSSTIQPGPHMLTLKGVDSAGNTGQTGLKLIVAQPIRVTIPLTQTEFELGEAVFIPARIETGTELVKVDFLFDGVVMDSRKTPPYACTFDSSELEVGIHTLSVQVEDSLGQIAEDSLSLNFLSPPREGTWAKRMRSWLGLDRPTFDRWLQVGKQGFVIVVALVAVVFTALAVFVVLRTVSKAHKRASRERYRLEIANMGNVPGHYQLWVEESLDSLNFQFVLMGRNLSPIATVQPVETTVKPVTTTTPARPIPVSAATAVGPAAGRSNNNKRVGQAKKVGAKAQGYLTVVDGILKTLSDLLPGSAGRSVRGLSQQLHAGETSVRQTTYAPKHIAGTASRLQGQVGHIAPATPKAERPVRDARGRAKTEILSVKPQVLETQVSAVPKTPVHIAAPTNGRQAIESLRVETPLVEPGQTLTVDLIIDPVNPYRKQSYDFTVNSQMVEQQGTEVVKAQGVAEIRGISWFRRFMSTFTVILLMVLLFFGIAYLTWWRLTGSDIFNWLPTG